MKIFFFIFLLPFLCLAQNSNDSVFFDSSKVQELDTVTVNATPEIKEMGHHNLRKTFLPIRTHILHASYFIGTYIKNPNPHRTAFVKNLILELESEVDTKILLRLYKFDPSSKTIEEMLFEKIIEVSKGNRKLQVPVEKDTLLFPANGLFFAVKLVQKGKVGIRYGRAKIEKEVPTYYFDPQNKRLMPIPVFPKTEKNFALMLGLSVEQY